MQIVDGRNVGGSRVRGTRITYPAGVSASLGPLYPSLFKLRRDARPLRGRRCPRRGQRASFEWGGNDAA